MCDKYAQQQQQQKQQGGKNLFTALYVCMYVYTG